MATISFVEVSKSYDGTTRAVDDLNLEIEDGEFLVLVGPSGCGKTTALRMIAGLEDITEGEVYIGDQVVNALQPRERDVAMVFQNYALYPHLSVRENIAFALRLRKLPKDEINRRVLEAARVLGLEEFLNRKPRALSGGQRQRVAMGRAIVREPQAFLMDEPLSNLDAKLRVQMRAEIARIQHRLGVTTVYVTHDQTEAMTLGDRVAVMKKGVLQQVDTPSELYDRPANLFVAGFIGSPAMNLLHARLSVNGGRPRLDVGSQRLELNGNVLGWRPALRDYDGHDLIVGIRPEDMAEESEANAPRNAVLHSTADLVEAMGSEMLVHFTVDAERVVTEDTQELERDAGTESLGRGRSPHSEVVARFTPRARVREGAPVSAIVDTERLHYFDPATGEAIWGDGARQVA